ncbi:MAG: molecular chaperone DnaJ [Planctomycetota bacterium]|nr:MAG: molecular chaperone DnaJ [Planctomycetota bacterium]
MLVTGEVRQALRVVFADRAPPPMMAVNEAQVKQAYRRRARATHPDHALHNSRGRSEAELVRAFRDLRQAYDVVLKWLARRRMIQPSPVPAPPPQPPPSPTPDPPPRSRSYTAPPPPRGPQSLPLRPMMLGEYLQWTGHITWQQRIQAIVWQRRQRPLIGALACQWRYLQSWQIAAVMRSRQGSERFAETALRLGWLTPFQFYALIGHQRRQQSPIGQYFIEQGLLTPRQLDRALEALNEHNRRHPQRFAGVRAS